MPFYSEKLQTHFAQYADVQNALAMTAYMKNHFLFFGIKAPDRKAILKQFIAKYAPPQYPDTFTVVWELYQLPQRELHYCAVEMLEKSKKNWQKDDIVFFEKLITTHAWWDTVDFISTHIIGAYFQKYPDQMHPITEQWMASGNMWLQRVCLICQLMYRQKTDTVLLFNYIHRLKGSNEFFIQKAIGWALRQYARTDALLVQDFVENTPLKPLSKREALKHFRVGNALLEINILSLAYSICV
jgi:3-methyladenine DNA glycosylase AlkD